MKSGSSKLPHSAACSKPVHVRSKQVFSQVPFEQGHVPGKLRMGVEHMHLWRHVRRSRLLRVSICVLACYPVSAQMEATRVGDSSVVASSNSQHASTERDGQHDFDWQLGTWT